MRAQEQGFYNTMQDGAKTSINKRFRAIFICPETSKNQKKRARGEHVKPYEVLSSPLMISISSSSDFWSKWV